MAYVAGQLLPEVGQRYRFPSGAYWDVTCVDHGSSGLDDVIVSLSLVGGRAIQRMDLADFLEATSPKPSG